MFALLPYGHSSPRTVIKALALRIRQELMERDISLHRDMDESFQQFSESEFIYFVVHFLHAFTTR